MQGFLLFFVILFLVHAYTWGLVNCILYLVHAKRDPSILPANTTKAMLVIAVIGFVIFAPIIFTYTMIKNFRLLQKKT